MSYKIDFNFESLLTLIKNPKRFCGIILINTVISLIIYFLIPKEYVSYATILPSSDTNNPGSLQALAAQFGYGSGKSDNPLIDPKVIKQISQNDKLSTKILKHTFANENENPQEIFYFLFPKSDINDLKDFELGKKDLNREHINVYQDLESSLIYINVTTDNPLLSYEICKLVFDYTINIINDIKSKNILSKLNYLNEKTEDIKFDLSTKQNLLREFEEKNILSTSPMLRMEIVKLQTEINVLTSVYLSLRTEQESLSIEVNDSNNEIYLIDEPYLPINKNFPRMRTLISLFILLNLFSFSLYVLRRSEIRKIDFQ
tara:strand:+ start:350 stop:1297 length:948 start_codon:yes stop_codon:yes gene_type:complete